MSRGEETPFEKLVWTNTVQSETLLSVQLTSTDAFSLPSISTNR